MLTKVKKLLGMSSGGDEMLGSISQFAGTYAPMGYMDCDGRTLQAKDWPALYAILGTLYGGQPGQAFNLPDLRPLGRDGQPDTGKLTRQDWSKQGLPRQVICVEGTWPQRP